MNLETLLQQTFENWLKGEMSKYGLKVLAIVTDPAHFNDSETYPRLENVWIPYPNNIGENLWYSLFSLDLYNDEFEWADTDIDTEDTFSDPYTALTDTLYKSSRVIGGLYPNSDGYGVKIIEA